MHYADLPRRMLRHAILRHYLMPLMAIDATLRFILSFTPCHIDAYETPRHLFDDYFHAFFRLRFSAFTEAFHYFQPP